MLVFMKRQGLLLGIFLFMAQLTFGQTLKGVVFDKETHEPLTGVNISYKKINGETDGTISGADGSYELQLPAGGVDVLFSYIGYENESLPLVL